MYITLRNYFLAGNPAAPLDQLWKLAVDADESVRRRVAENPAAGEHLLRLLYIDQSADVRIAVAENPSCPQDLIQHLVNDKNDDVRFAIAENPNVALEVLAALSEAENPFVSERAKRTISRIEPPDREPADSPAALLSIIRDCIAPTNSG